VCFVFLYSSCSKYWDPNFCNVCHVHILYHIIYRIVSYIISYIPYHTISYIIPYHIIYHHIVLYYIILYYIILYYITAAGDVSNKVLKIRMQVFNRPIWLLDLLTVGKLIFNYRRTKTHGSVKWVWITGSENTEILTVWLIRSLTASILSLVNVNCWRSVINKTKQIISSSTLIKENISLFTQHTLLSLLPTVATQCQPISLCT